MQPRLSCGSIGSWLFIDGAYSYAHYLEFYEALLNSASDGVIVAEFFRGSLGAAPPPAAWVFFEG